MNDDDLARWAATAFASRTTPAVVIDAGRVTHNIIRAISVIGDASRWRPHVKTARIPWTIRELRRRGVSKFKASTTAEVQLLLDCGATDVLLAYPAVGPSYERMLTLAREHPGARVAALVEDLEIARTWAAELGAFVDVDTGQGRTGVPVGDAGRVARLLDVLHERGVTERGLHTYDGHLADLTPERKQAAVDEELAGVVTLAEHLEEVGLPLTELVAGSTHTLAEVARATLPERWSSRVTLGAGTLVYNDLRSMGRYHDDGYLPAAFAVTRVVSHRGAGRVTVDAGLTTIQVDAGRPHAAVLALPTQTLTPSQEHLEIALAAGDDLRVGDVVLLVPRHVDTMIAQFDSVHVTDGDQLWTDHTPRRPV